MSAASGAATGSGFAGSSTTAEYSAVSCFGADTAGDLSLLPVARTGVNVKRGQRVASEGFCRGKVPASRARGAARAQGGQAQAPEASRGVTNRILRAAAMVSDMSSSSGGMSSSALSHSVISTRAPCVGNEQD